ncbi:MAG: cellulase family glycosylhydrolase [Actinobacteria bacterium]|nr:cellulase family glycosylhydrolase [Actinomycetota bacterium]
MTLSSAPPSADAGTARGPRPMVAARSARWGRRGAVAIVLGVAVTAGVLLPQSLDRGSREICGADALQAAAVDGLAHFAQWLSANHSAGYVGEVGWPSGPDAQRWNALADTWYSAADTLGLPVTAWSAARWPASYPMSVYRAGTGSTELDSRGPQAGIVEAHGSTRGYLRGVVLAGGSFGAADTNPAFGSLRPGRYGYDYSYESPASYQYLARRGVRLVRMAVAWERLQPVPGGPLDATAVSTLRRALDHAGRAGLRVIVDLHGYGAFAAGPGPGAGQARRLLLGSAGLPTGALADFWRRTVPAVAGLPAVIGYGLLNEPVTLAERGMAGARLWERASQQAVTAIRQAGGAGLVLVAGYGSTSPARWGSMHPRAWIQDPAGLVRYDAHAYFDADGSGHYAASYAEALRAAELAPPPACHRMSALAGTGGRPA